MKKAEPMDITFTLVDYLTHAVDRAKFALSLDNELARMSALNHLIGYLQGGLEIAKMNQKSIDAKEDGRHG